MTRNYTSIEASVIGAALLNRQFQDELISLEQTDMETQRGADILAAMKLMRESGVKIDLVTLNAKTEQKYTEYLIDASTQSALLVYQFDENIRLLKENSLRRKIAREANKLLNTLAEPFADLADAVGETIDNLRRLATDNSDRCITSREAVLAFADDIRKQDVTKGKFGVAPLDDALGGMFGEKLIVVGARPATGKSALAVSAAMATQVSGRVLFFSYEMKPEEIVGRMVANLSGIDAQRIARRELEQDDFHALSPAMDGASRFDIVFKPSANTPAKIRAEALRQNKDGKLALIVVDYLQQMSSGQKAESRRVEVGQISRALKQLAMEIGVPVLALSQLNRQSEGSPNRAPSMAEMRESGDIEQDADVIILMHTPPANNDHVEQINRAGLACVRLTLEKNRQGRSGQVIDVAFDGSRMAFYRALDVIGGEQ